MRKRDESALEQSGKAYIVGYYAPLRGIMMRAIPTSCEAGRVF